MTLTRGISKYDYGGYRWQCCCNGIRKSGIADTIAIAQHDRQQAINAIKVKCTAQPKVLAVKATDCCITLAEAIKAMLDADWNDIKSETTIKSQVRHIYTYFDKSMPLSQLTSKVIDGYVSFCKDSGLMGSTINRHLSVLSKILHRAELKGEIDKAPYIERQKESGGRVRYITDEEEKEILECINSMNLPRFRAIVEVLIDTGMRCGELVKLKKIEVMKNQGKNGIVYLSDTKNGTDRAVPLTTKAANAIEYLMSTDNTTEKVLTESYQVMLKYWTEVRHKLGKDGDAYFILHILRHTCCSRLVQKGASIKKVQAWLGHKAIQTTMRYAHLAPKDLYDMTTLLEK